jgi:glycosyltransferase involved in cell wall biosynthesis
MREPFFSVLVTAYNRPREIERCVGSCSRQTWTDFEVVVVDDASTDDTIVVLERIDEPRLRVVPRDHNGGISAARATAVQAARGEWFVMLDSDWELLPHSLARLREVIDRMPAGVRIIRSRLQWDDGHIEPDIMPDTSITGYRGRMAWVEQVTKARVRSDAGHCIHSSVFETTNYFADRRGAMEGLWELDLAQHESSLWVPDVLGIQYTDAVNSYSRDANLSTFVPGLIREAPDMQWMYETLLARHGDEIAVHAPTWRRRLYEGAAGQAFLAGHRGAGVRHSLNALRGDWGNGGVWGTLVPGLIGPRVLAYAKTARRGARARLLTQAKRAATA